MIRPFSQQHYRSTCSRQSNPFVNKLISITLVNLLFIAVVIDAATTESSSFSATSMNRVTDSLTKRGILAPIVLVDEHRNVTKNATLTSGGKRLIHAGKAKNKMNRQSTTTTTTTTAAVKRAFNNETFLLNSAEQVIELNSSLGEDMSGRNRRQLSACYSNPCNSGTCYDLNLRELPLGGFYCVCPVGFTGSQCEKEINECLSSPCKNGAQCLDLIASYFCSCPSGYTGVLCETPIRKQICPENACGEGECVLTTHPKYQYACKCKDGSYKFEPCTSTNNVKKCDPNPCAPNQCIEAPNSPTGYVCQCGSNDFRPSNCLDLKSSCEANSCYNGGSCVPYSADEPWCNSVQSQQTCCQCVTGFTGFRCETEINECASNPCQNGGICDNMVNSYRCNCPLGFTGSNCELPQGCKNNPCKFGGTCIVSEDGSEYCRCREGFSGSNCEIDINECASSPCQNGGTCIDLENSYACYCPDGYFRPTFCPASLTSTTMMTSTSTMLSTSRRTSTSAAPTTTMISPSRTAATKRLPKTTTSHKQAVTEDDGLLDTTMSSSVVQQLVTPCQQNICFNGGSCFIVAQSGFICVCKEGDSGDMCQYSIASASSINTRLNCFPNPCANGAVCTTRGCICSSGYTGQYCETLSSVNRCSQVQCMNGGSCVETLSGITTTAYCNCKAGFTGNRCETEYFRCSKDGIFTDIYGCDNGRYLECVYYGQTSVGLTNGILFRRDCPPGLRYNPTFGYCDYAANVECPSV